MHRASARNADPAFVGSGFSRDASTSHTGKQPSLNLPLPGHPCPVCGWSTTTHFLCRSALRADVFPAAPRTKRSIKERTSSRKPRAHTLELNQTFRRSQHHRMRPALTNSSPLTTRTILLSSVSIRSILYISLLLIRTNQFEKTSLKISNHTTWQIQRVPPQMTISH